MISPRHKAIFLHVGKTAGTSIERMLVPVRFDPEKKSSRFMFGRDREEGGIFLQHATCATLRRLLGADVFDACYKFTVVRDPFARLLSVFSYHSLASETDGSEFKRFVLDLPRQVADPVIGKGTHVLAQVHYAQIDGTTVVDHIARFEDLPASIDPVRQHLGIERQLEHKNAQPRPPALSGRSAAEMYDDEMVAVMRQVYAADFATFGYPDHPGDPT